MAETDLAALASAICTLVSLGISTLAWGVANNPIWTFIWEHHLQLITANLIVVFSLSTLTYLRSFSVEAGNTSLRELAKGGQSGNVIYDWFIGRELNPRFDLPLFGTVDLKFWCELRPGLLGWMVLNLTYMAHQYTTFGSVSDSMLLVVALQSLYVFDSLYMEHAILTTIDITTDGFGFMLAFGDLVWVPFVYSLQGRYLAMHPVHLGFNGVVGVLAVQGLGYYIFRASNNEKDRFRANPNDPRVSNLKYITTSQGSRLLVSGWWGTARHINYLGDWIIAWSWCLPTGLSGFLINQAASKDAILENRCAGLAITYFYVVYVAVLLAHRESRDEEKCSRKYGKDWDAYKKLVRWRIIPYIY